LFFGMFSIAALSSAISLLEVVVSFAVDEYGLQRPVATALIGGGIFILGVPVALVSDGGNPIVIDLYDILAAEILLITGGILVMVLMAWFNPNLAVTELSKGIGRLGILGSLWIWLVRIPVIVVLLISLGLALVGYYEFLVDEFIPFVRG